MSKNNGLPDRWPTDIWEESNNKKGMGPNIGSNHLARGQEEDMAEPNIQAKTSASAGENYESESSGNLVAKNNGKLARKNTRPQRGKPPRANWMIRFLSRWELWAVLTLMGSGGLGGWSLTTLLQVPPEPNCEENFWALVSARERLYCAQQEANQETVKGLLDAIAHANKLPKDHAMRSQIDRQIEEWSAQLLDLAEQMFQGGKLTESIAVANQIPSSTETAKTAKERIERWESIWNKGEKISEKIDKLLEEGSWFDAFGVAQELLGVNNTYWQTTKYDGINDLIQATQEEGKTIEEVRSKIEAGGLKNFRAAIKLAETVSTKSKLYKQSRLLLDEISGKMMAMARGSLQAEDWQEAIYIARQVPYSSQVKKEADDFIELAQAHSLAWRKTVRTLEDAIAKAERIKPNSAVYDEARRLARQWKQEIKGVAFLERARNRAQVGTVRDLKAAITEAQLIGNNNPIWQEAQTEISQWRQQIQVSEDSPYLTEAEDLAIFGDPASLQAAIATANRIRPGRPLYRDAQNKVELWQREIQRTQDQPTLEQAQKLADGGNLESAIAMAERIAPGRSLYNQAQSSIFAWRNEIRDSKTLEKAYRLGNSATTSAALVQAIETANQVSYVGSLRSQAEGSINRWSQRLFQMAVRESNSDIEAAIQLARRIPFYAGNYQEVQQQINAWKRIVEPPPVVRREEPRPAPSPETASPEPAFPEPASPEPERSPAPSATFSESNASEAPNPEENAGIDEVE